MRGLVIALVGALIASPVMAATQQQINDLAKFSAGLQACQMIPTKEEADYIVITFSNVEVMFADGWGRQLADEIIQSGRLGWFCDEFRKRNHD